MMMLLKPLSRTRRRGRSALARVTALGAALSLFLSACQGLPFQLPEGIFPGSTQGSRTPGSSTAPATPGASQTTGAPLSGGTATLAPTASPSPERPGAEEQPASITLWLPPQFDPSSGSPAGNLLKARLGEFTRQEQGLEVVVRVKAASGPGGLLDALTAASAAAPDALPDLAALARPDLETAALKGLLRPYETNAGDLDGADWYPFAREMGMIQGSIFGLPFAADAQVLLYRPGQNQGATPPADLAALFAQPSAVAFSPADPQALVTLALYQAAGGSAVDELGRPALNPDALAAALKLYAQGIESGAIPGWLSSYETDGQAWQAYREGRAAWAITWASRYLADLPADTALLPLPPMPGAAAPGSSPGLANGWSWALARPEPLRRSAAARLAVFLTEPGFLAEWNRAAGVLPPRPSALESWPNQGTRNALASAALTAQVRPSGDLLVSLGPVLRDAALSVIRRESDPAQAAQAASEKLKGPQ